jgi:hypothetical protein
LDEGIFLFQSDLKVSNTNFRKGGINGFGSISSITKSSFSKISGRAISFWDESDVSVKDVHIEDANIGIEVFKGGKIAVSDTAITNVDEGIQIFNEVNLYAKNLNISECSSSGIGAYDPSELLSTVSIENSVIHNCEYGIFLIGTKVDHIVHNSIYDNTYGAFVIGNNVVDMMHNWWGSVKGPATLDNLEGEGNPIFGNVTIFPWLLSEFSQSRDPVIIIPGITGTRLIKDFGENRGIELWPNLSLLITDFDDSFLKSLSLMPDGKENPEFILKTGDIVRTATTIDIFKGLITSFTDIGYKENIDLFVFPYDWRLSNEDNKEILKEKIDNILLQTGHDKVDIISHSMGGILAKSYFSSYGGNNIDQVFFIGVPHLGSPKAFQTLMYGDDMGINFLGISLLNKQRIKIISQNMPSIYELLPSKKYVEKFGSYIEDMVGKYLPTTRQDRYLSYDEIKNFMISEGRNSLMFPFANIVHSATDELDLSSVRTYNFSDCASKAISKITINKKRSLKILGIPIINDISLSYIKGDGTVPLQSSEFGTYKEQYYINQGSHGNLPSVPAVRESILKLLQDETFDDSDHISHSSSFCNISGKVIEVHSPVTLNIYDTAGNHTGPVLDGTIEYGIPGVMYDIIEEQKFAFLPDNEDYRVINQAEKTGTYDLYISSIDNDDIISQQQYFIDIPITSLSMTAELNIPTITEGSYVLQLDQNGDGIYESQKNASSNLEEELDEKNRGNTVKNKSFDDITTQPTVPIITEYIDSSTSQKDNIKNLSIAYKNSNTEKKNQKKEQTETSSVRLETNNEEIQHNLLATASSKKIDRQYFIILGSILLVFVVTIKKRFFV